MVSGNFDENFTAELEAYNHAFRELELPWHWDASTFRELIQNAPDRDLVGTYVQRSHAHLLRVYEKPFLSNLVLAAKARYEHHEHLN